MTQPAKAPRLQAFTVGDWTVDPRACLVARGETVIKVRPQLLELLQCLALHAGEIVLKDEILAAVWPGQYIAESGLSRCMAELRQVLQDEAQAPRYIETIAKRGYRLVAPVAWLPAAEPAHPAERGSIPGAAAEARTPASPLDTPERAAARRRSAWAVAAIVLLAVAVIAAAVFRRTPAQPFTDRDAVVLAFENHTGDAVFDETIPLAMSIHLEQSPHLALLSAARMSEVLQMMKRPPDTPLDRAVGLEVCERAGAHAVFVTSITSLGRQYAIGIEAVGCGSGQVLARRQVTTDRKERVLAALQQPAVEMRTAVGEPAASLAQYNVPVVEATTASLEALRAVRRGDRAFAQGHTDQAEAFYREAAGLDPDFALALNRLASMTLGAERETALRRAYALRQHTTFPERLEIEASYHRWVTGDVARVVAALESLRQSHPRRALARRDLSVEYMNVGRFGAALSEALEAVRLEPNSAFNLTVAARAHLYLNQIDAARKAAEQALALGSTAVDPHVLLFWCGVAARDAALRGRELAWMSAHPSSMPFFSEDLAEESMNRGRLAEAIRYMTEFEAWARADPLVSDWPARVRLRIARYEALCGFERDAMRRVDAELATDLGPVATMDAVRVMVSAGRFDQAERVLDKMAREGQPGTSQPSATLARAYRAAIAASRERTAEALELFAPLEPYELGYAFGFVPAFERARAHDLAGDWRSARAVYEKILAHPWIDSASKLIPHAELGLARALARAGDLAGSRRAYERFFDRWQAADAGLPVLLQARREYAALSR